MLHHTMSIRNSYYSILFISRFSLDFPQGLGGTGLTIVVDDCSDLFFSLSELRIKVFPYS